MNFHTAIHYSQPSSTIMKHLKYSTFISHFLTLRTSLSIKKSAIIFTILNKHLPLSTSKTHLEPISQPEELSVEKIFCIGRSQA